MRSPRFLLLAGCLGATGVGLGAFGAHALKEQLASAGMTGVWEKAVLYHLLHGLGVLLLASRPTSSGVKAEKWLDRVAAFWVAGVVCFSGSLYGLALGGPRLLGPITPIGGILFILGWLCVMMAGFRAAAERSER